MRVSVSSFSPYHRRLFFFFNDTATTEIYTLSLHDALPDLILFVDELHNLIGQGTALGAAMDAANMLKPALVRAAGPRAPPRRRDHGRRAQGRDRPHRPVRSRARDRKSVV